jgi:hypothetical protein
MAFRSAPDFRRLRFWSLTEKSTRGTAALQISSLLVTSALAGCSVSFPISPLLWPGTSADTAADAPPQAFVRMLDAGDWRRAKTALSTALDPQGNDAPAAWMNPESGNKGSFAPVGKAFSSNAGICRPFLANVERKDGGGSLEGTACAGPRGEWTIAEAKPWKKV